MASGVKTADADVPTSFVRPEQARSPITLGQTKDLRISLADPCILILYMPWFFLPSSRLSEGQTCGVLRRVLSTKGKVMEEQIITKLTNALAPVHLEVVNESYKHNAESRPGRIMLRVFFKHHHPYFLDPNSCAESRISDFLRIRFGREIMQGPSGESPM